MKYINSLQQQPPCC